MRTTGDITGWMFPGQLIWLGEQARTRYRIAEIGAWKGLSTRALADATPGKVWVVDQWRSDNPEDEATEEMRRVGREAVFDAFCESMKSWAHKLVIMRMESLEAWKRLGHMKFDMIFIDADHRYEPARRDILHWRAMLAPGGMICGHDGEHPGVSKAVAELVPGAKFHSTPQPPPFGPGLIWYWSNAVE